MYIQCVHTIYTCIYIYTCVYIYIYKYTSYYVVLDPTQALLAHKVLHNENEIQRPPEHRMTYHQHPSKAIRASDNKCKPKKSKPTPRGRTQREAQALNQEH